MRARNTSWWWGWGLGGGLCLAGCMAAAPPNGAPLHTQASPGTETISPTIEVQWVANLSEREEAAVRHLITRHLETSGIDHYPTVQALHIVPGPQPETYVFVARVAISGFTPSRYRMIGQYDRRQQRITVLEHRSRPLWLPERTPDPLCPETRTEPPVDVA